MEEKYLHLIIKKDSGEATEEELVQLQEWLASDGFNQKEMAITLALLKRTQQTFVTYEPDTEGEWEKLRQKMEMQKKNHPILSMPKKHLRIAATTIILAGLMVYLFQFFENGESIAIEEQTPKETILQTTDSAMQFYLPDSSLVVLGSYSKLTFVALDGPDGIRKANLTGEAFFVVKRDTSHQFIVSTGMSEIKALGTSFNVIANEGAATIKVQVVDGTVEFTVFDPINENSSLILHKNQEAVYDFNLNVFLEETKEKAKVEKITKLDEEIQDLDKKKVSWFKKVRTDIGKKLSKNNK